MKKNYILLLLMVLFSVAFGCSKGDSDANEKSVRVLGTMTVDGRVRDYIVDLPSGYYQENTQLSLVICLHGGGGSGEQFASNYGFSDFANQQHFIAAFPNGVRNDGVLGLRTWNAGSCCDYAMSQNVDDVKFIRELIDELIQKYRIDKKRVYITGMSNGGMMAYRLACEIPEKIAAIAPVSCTMVLKKEIKSSRAMPILHIHSMLDQKVPYYGGIGVAGYYYPPVDSVLYVWSKADGCDATPEVISDTSGFTHSQWKNCNDQVVIDLYQTKDGGHSWPGAPVQRALADKPSTAVNANEEIWKFFQQYQLP